MFKAKGKIVAQVKGRQMFHSRESFNNQLNLFKKFRNRERYRNLGNVPKGASCRKPYLLMRMVAGLIS